MAGNWDSHAIFDTLVASIDWRRGGVMGLFRKAAHRYATSWGMGAAVPRESTKERPLRDQTELLREQNRLNPIIGSDC